MATANYNTTYNSAAGRGYHTSYQGASTSQRIRHYIGGYVKAYAHLTTVAYEGVYAKNYSHDWAQVFTGYYTKVYVGQYTKTYEGNWTGTYAADYAKQYHKLWSHNWVAAYSSEYEGQYAKQYEGSYSGQYTGNYSNDTAYETQYEGSYEGYFARDGVGLYDKQWEGQYAGSRDHLEQFTAYYGADYTGSYDGSYDKQWEGQYTGFYEGTRFAKIWSRTFNSYREAFATRSAQWAGNRSYSGQYAGSRTHNYSGSRSYQITATSQYNSPLQWTKTWTGAYTGSGPSTFWGPRAYYTPYYPYVWYDYEPMPWTGAAGTYYGQYNAQYHLVWTGTASPTSVGYYTGPTGQQRAEIWQGAPAPNGMGYEGVEVWYESEGGFLYTIYIPRIWTGYGPASWLGMYNIQGNYSKQWTTATVYNAQYDSTWNAQYGGTKTYYGQYTGYYAQHLFYIGPSVTIDYDQYYSTNYTHQWTGQYTKTYDGARDHTYSKVWSHIWEGPRTYDAQYTGQYTKTYEQYWTGVYTGLYTGLQTYGAEAKTTGANFTHQWTGVYSKLYEKLYTGYYTGYWEKAYEHQYANSYTGYYAGSREHTYVGYYDAQYEGSFETAYAGNYGNVFTAYYTGYYTGYYSRNYIGYYSKGYTGTYAGGSGSYSGVTNYTKSYLGTVSYDRVWVGASPDNIKSGQLATQAVAKIKDGGAWKDTKELFIKKNGAWAESKAVYAKKDGVWEIVHIGWERTDLNINSNKRNFNLHTELVAAGASPGTRPQLVNIYVNSGAVFSTTSTPAMDLTSSMGTINIGGTSIKHLVRVFVHPDARIIGASGEAGTVNPTTRSGTSGGNGHDAIKTNAAIELYIENYGIIAGGGGGGGAGGYPVNGSTLVVAGGAGGVGAGFAILNGSDGVDILENDSRINGTNASVALGIHGGSGGLLGQRGSGAGGYDHPAGNIANPGTLKSQYDLSGDGGLPGSAIVGYDATRVTFINTGKIWGDSKYKFI